LQKFLSPTELKESIRAHMTLRAYMLEGHIHWMTVRLKKPLGTLSLTMRVTTLMKKCH